MYMVRSEWGANANSHIHRHVISEAFSRFFCELKNRLKLQNTRVEFEIPADDRLLESDLSRSAIDTRLDAAWRVCQRQLYRAYRAVLYQLERRASPKTVSARTTLPTIGRRPCARMASVWTCDALPSDFERLSPRDFDVDGVSSPPPTLGHDP